jgi:hypothetical protein
VTFKSSHNTQAEDYCYDAAQQRSSQVLPQSLPQCMHCPLCLWHLFMASQYLIPSIELRIQAIGTALLDAQTLHLHAVLIHAQSYAPYEKSWMSVVDGGMYPWGK